MPANELIVNSRNGTGQVPIVREHQDGAEYLSLNLCRRKFAMANPEHLAKLKEGVVAWNAWKLAFSTGRVDLSAADLSGMIVEGADLNETDVRGAYAGHATLATSAVGRTTTGTKLRFSGYYVT